MSGFGSTNPFPRRFGGSRRPRTLERQALERVFKKDGFDVSEGTTRAAEAYAFSGPVAIVWACNERLRGAEVPSTMMETLPTFEEVLKTRPSSEDSIVARRNHVAAKLRAIAGQATSEDIEDVCRILLGSSYEGMAKLEENAALTYWPGQNPGPPGFEWCSSRCTLAIYVEQGTVGNAIWNRTLTQLHQLLHTLLPAWMTFYVGRNDGGFFPDVSLPDLVLLGS